MRIVRLHTTSPADNRDAVRDAFLNRTVVNCGIAAFEPGCYAHTGEKHFHEDDEVFIILNGEITVPITNGPTDIARAGDWVLVEAGRVHP